MLNGKQYSHSHRPHFITFNSTTHSSNLTNQHLVLSVQQYKVTDVMFSYSLLCFRNVDVNTSLVIIRSLESMRSGASMKASRWNRTDMRFTSLFHSWHMLLTDINEPMSVMRERMNVCSSTGTEGVFGVKFFKVQLSSSRP